MALQATPSKNILHTIGEQAESGAEKERGLLTFLLARACHLMASSWIHIESSASVEATEQVLTKKVSIVAPSLDPAT